MFADDLSQESPAEEPTIQTGIMTAAQMLAAAGHVGPAVNPEAFELAMDVTHPLYGLGKIIALSGSRDKRTATVQFRGSGGQRKFRLAHCPLRPASS
jgi:hypothetical protein